MHVYTYVCVRTRERCLIEAAASGINIHPLEREYNYFSRVRGLLSFFFILPPIVLQLIVLQRLQSRVGGHEEGKMPLLLAAAANSPPFCSQSHPSPFLSTEFSFNLT